MPVTDYLPLTMSEACFLCDALYGQYERLHGEHAADVLDRAMFDALDFDRRDVAKIAGSFREFIDGLRPLDPKEVRA